MAMNGNELGTQIANLITSSNAPPESRDAILQLWQQIGTAIVSHIQNNAVVTVTGVQSGPGTAPGTVN